MKAKKNVNATKKVEMASKAIKLLSITEQRMVSGGAPWPPNYIKKQPKPAY